MITNTQEKFMHALGDIYDAEHQFLQAQQQMVQKASDSKLQQMITQHIQESEQQIQNLEQVFNILGSRPHREECPAAKGIVQEGQHNMQEAQNNPAILDCMMADSASKVEHYEISSYRGLITAAQLMGDQDVVRLFQQNLQQEEKTAQTIEYSAPELLKKAMQAEGQSASS